MHIVTIRDVIKADVPQFIGYWERNGADGEALWKRGWTHRQIIDALKALDLDTCTREELNAVYGNERVRFQCDECGVESEALVHIGDEPDYEVRYLRLCRDCLGVAFRLIPIPGPPAPPPPTRPMQG